MLWQEVGQEQLVVEPVPDKYITLLLHPTPRPRAVLRGGELGS
jgi:hypothetical protein